MNEVPTTPVGWVMSEAEELFRRLLRRDPLLVARVYAGDPATTEAAVRLLRLTPLALLRQHTGALVDLLAALPEVHGRLRHSWQAVDPAFTAQVFTWAEQARLRLHRVA